MKLVNWDIVYREKEVENQYNNILEIIKINYDRAFPTRKIIKKQKNVYKGINKKILKKIRYRNKL